MPIYEYECQKCHELTEIMQKISDPPPGKCPSCGGKKMQRVMSQTSFQLKGDGWYITDYSRKDKEAKSKKKDDGPSTTSEAKSDKPAETKDKEKTAKPAKGD